MSLKVSIFAGLAVSLASTTAFGAGFERGTADTDILFENSSAMRAGVTIVNPTQRVGRINGPSAFAGRVFNGRTGGYNTPAYIVPSFAAKVDFTNDLACAGTFTTPFGGHTDYSRFRFQGTTPIGFDPFSNTGSSETEFHTKEFGLTCSYAFDVGPGRARIIGGGFLQTLDYEQTSLLGSGQFELSNTDFGYRVGAAYEIPEIALRAQLMYRSAVDVDATGTFTKVGPTLTGNAFVDGAPIGTVLNPAATGSAEFPQSVELKLQSGVAPGWLVYGSVKWTDWSSFDTLNYVALTPNTLNFFYDDSWKVQLGVAHVFTEELAGTVNLTYDQGTGTGHDVSGDTWTLAAGGSYKPRENVELRFGAGYTWIEGGTVDFIQNAAGGAVAAPGLKTFDDGYALGGSLSVAVKF